LRPMIAAAAGHHHRFESGGYGTPGESRQAGIVSVADAFDAMTSTRAYRQALEQQVAFAELEAKAGTQFDPAYVAALIAAITTRDEHFGLGFEPDAVDYDVPPPIVGPGSAGLGDRSCAATDEMTGGTVDLRMGSATANAGTPSVARRPSGGSGEAGPSRRQ
jgi:hypothetical protein